MIQQNVRKVCPKLQKILIRECMLFCLFSIINLQPTYLFEQWEEENNMVIKTE